MGCDIHMWAEIKQDKSWKTVGNIFKNDYHDKNKLPIMEYFDDDSGSEWNEVYNCHPYDNRNYALFGVLADVRGSSEFDCIAVRKGVPNDASAYYKHQVEEWDSDGHSHSYLTLKELQDADFGHEYVMEFKDTIKELEKLQEYKDVQDVRIVFFFDN